MYEKNEKTDRIKNMPDKRHASEIRQVSDIKSDAKTKNLPEQKFRAGALTATIWKNSSEKDTKTVEYMTGSCERNYLDRSGGWQTTNSLRVNDLPKAMLVIGKAYEYLLLKESESNESDY